MTVKILWFLPYFITLLGKIYLYYMFYLFKININNVFFYLENVINTGILKIN